MRKVVYLSVLLPLLTISLWAQEQKNRVPLVTNVKAEQVDFEHVLIRYDVEDLDGDTMTVSVKVSANNKRSFDVPVTELEGAVSEGIAAQVRRSCGLSLRMWLCINTERVMQ